MFTFQLAVVAVENGKLYVTSILFGVLVACGMELIGHLYAGAYFMPHYLPSTISLVSIQSTSMLLRMASR